ncbi:hypothetical protein JHK87_016756 [Glycine soja]|nr:hypothetical protein JHK87_016756 [Glycine soja]
MESLPIMNSTTQQPKAKASMLTKGISSFALPYKRTPPNWLKISSQEVLIGVKFLPTWSFIGYLRVCFVEPPYFQMTINPVYSWA